MKRLQFVYRKNEDGRTRTVRISLPEPIDNIENIPQSELVSDINLLKTLGLVPEDYEADEIRITESNSTLYLNLIE